jgi:hypothetical protein
MVGCSLSGKRAPYGFTMSGKKVGSTLKVRKRGPKVVSLREAQSTKRDWVVVGFLVVPLNLWAIVQGLLCFSLPFLICGLFFV